MTALCRNCPAVLHLAANTHLDEWLWVDNAGSMTGQPFHEHYPAGSPPSPLRYQGTRPEHCGWPAWLRPSGWHCRQCRQFLGPARVEIVPGGGPR
jgi:hypothetical protein